MFTPVSKLNSDLFLGTQSEHSGQECVLQKVVSDYLVEHPLPVILGKGRNLNKANEVMEPIFLLHLESPWQRCPSPVVSVRLLFVVLISVDGHRNLVFSLKQERGATTFAQAVLVHVNYNFSMCFRLYIFRKRLFCWVAMLKPQELSLAVFAMQIVNSPLRFLGSDFPCLFLRCSFYSQALNQVRNVF